MTNKWVEEHEWIGTWRGHPVDLRRVDKVATAVAMLGTTSPDFVRATPAERAAGLLIAAHADLARPDIDEAWEELIALMRVLKFTERARALRRDEEERRARAALRGAF